MKVNRIEEPTDEDKLVILERELRMWANTRYQNEVRYKVAKRIGPVETADEAAMIKEMETCQKWMDALNDEISELEKKMGKE